MLRAGAVDGPTSRSHHPLHDPSAEPAGGEPQLWPGRVGGADPTGLCTSEREEALPVPSGTLVPFVLGGPTNISSPTSNSRSLCPCQQVRVSKRFRLQKISLRVMAFAPKFSQGSVARKTPSCPVTQKQAVWWNALVCLLYDPSPLRWIARHWEEALGVYHGRDP